MIVIRWLMAMALTGCVTASAQPAVEVPPSPYLLMVTSLDPPLSRLSDTQVALLNDAPFDAVAISILGIYDGGPLPDEAALLERCAQLRELSAHQVWPRVYLNRLIGFLPTATRRSACQNPEYFDPIRGFDLWDDAGARGDFLALWRLSLRAAKALGAPGVVADFESYNCGGLANPSTLAAATGRTLPEVQTALRALGGMLTEIAAEEYPDALIWTLFTGFGRPDWFHVDDRPLPALHSYINEGLLQRATELELPLRLVSGGEMSLGYYSESVEALQAKIQARAEAFAPWLERFGERLVLGGTITVWNDDARLTGWARKAAGEDPPFECFADFQPLLAELFASYRHIWPYVPMVTDYNPFDAATAPDLNAALRATLSAAGWRPVATGGDHDDAR